VRAKHGAICSTTLDSAATNVICDWFLHVCWSAERAMDRDTFLSAEEALNFGLIDEVLRQRPKAEP